MNNNFYSNGNSGYPQYPAQNTDIHSIEYLNLLSKYNNAEKEMQYYRSEYSSLVNKIKTSFPQLLSNNYNLQQLGSKGIDLSNVNNLIDFAIKDIFDSKKSLLEKFQETQAKIYTVQSMLENKQQTIDEQDRIIQDKDIQIKALEEEILKLKSEKSVATKPDISQQFAQTIAPEPPKIENPKPQLLQNTPSQPSQEKIAVIQQEPAETELRNIKPVYAHERKQMSKDDFKARNIKKKDTNSGKPCNPVSSSSFKGTVFAAVAGPKIKAVRSDEDRMTDENSIQQEKQTVSYDPEIIISSLNDTQKMVVEAVGKTGASTTAEVEDITKKDASGISRIIKDLDTFNILHVETIDSGIARKKNIFRLTEFGAEIFKRLYNQEPCEANCEKIRKQHDNYTHGYTIMSVAQTFKDRFKAENLTTDRNTLTFKLPDGKTYIPDIAFAQDGQQYYVEVELGNTPEDAFFDKCNKMRQITKTLFFVSNTKDNLNTVRKSVDKWIHKCLGGKEELTGYTIKYASAADLSHGKITDTIKF